MWHWRLNELYNQMLVHITVRRIFLSYLMLFVLFVHLLVLLGYSLISWLTSTHERFEISLTQRGATYVIMPLHKKVDLAAQKKKNKDVAGSDQKSKVIDHETYLKKMHNKKSKTAKANSAKANAAQPQLKSQEVSKPVVEHPAQVSASIEQEPEAPFASLVLKTSVAMSKAALKKKAAQEKNKKLEKKAKLKAQRAKAQREKAKKSKLKKSKRKLREQVTAKVATVESQAQVTSAAVAQEIKPEPVATQPAIADAPVETGEAVGDGVADDFDPNNVIFIGYEQLDQSVVGSKIQHAIEQAWTPPAGMSPEMVCELQVLINDQGQAESIKIMKSSGAFVYDVAARKALSAIEFPQEVYQKTITIALGAS